MLARSVSVSLRTSACSVSRRFLAVAREPPGPGFAASPTRVPAQVSQTKPQMAGANEAEGFPATLLEI